MASETLNLSVFNLLDWCPVRPWICLSPSCLSLLLLCPDFCMGVWDPNLGPHACLACALPLNCIPSLRRLWVPFAHNSTGFSEDTCHLSMQGHPRVLLLLLCFWRVNINDVRDAVCGKRLFIYHLCVPSTSLRTFSEGRVVAVGEPSSETLWSLTKSSLIVQTPWSGWIHWTLFLMDLGLSLGSCSGLLGGCSALL